MDVRSGKGLSDSLDAAVVPSNPYFNTMLRILATRCMMQAVYFCSGVVAPEDYLHYGLAAPIYTHFTSPIRRFACSNSLIVSDFIGLITKFIYKNCVDKFYELPRRFQGSEQL